jgi:hypothetical protein
MTNIYDYNKNINIVTTPSGDKVITMNQQILTVIENALFDAADWHNKEGRDATYRDLVKLRQVLCDKEGK